MESLWKKIGFKTSNDGDKELEEDLALHDIDVKQNRGFTTHFKKYAPV